VTSISTRSFTKRSFYYTRKRRRERKSRNRVGLWNVRGSFGGSPVGFGDFFP
jgi:hypothetical protein